MQFKLCHEYYETTLYSEDRLVLLIYEKDGKLKIRISTFLPFDFEQAEHMLEAYTMAFTIAKRGLNNG